MSRFFYIAILIPPLFNNVYSNNLECINTADIPDYCIETQNYGDQFPRREIAIFFHHIYPDIGPSVVSNENINEYLTFINNDFNDGNISFVEVGRQIIRNSNYYNNTPGSFQSLKNSYSHVNAIDIYLLGPSGAGDSGSIPSQNVVIGSEWLGSHVISHEIGHALGLLHTHDFSIEIEDPIGNNCSIAGDCVCDTPADPDLHHGECVDGNCDYIPLVCYDFNDSGDVVDEDPYNPDTENIMSYTNLECLNHFTFGQFEKIHSSFSFYQILSDVEIILSAPSNLIWTNVQNHPLLQWSLINDPNLIGYNIYRALSESDLHCNNYEKIDFISSDESEYLDFQIDIANMKFANNKARYYVTSVHTNGKESFHSNKVQAPTKTRERSVVTLDNSWNILPEMNKPRTHHTATVLETGDVLVAGGRILTNNVMQLINQCEIFDVIDYSWTIIDSLNDSKYGHTSTKLNNGDILVVGGETEYGSIVCVERYDIDDNNWVFMDTLLTPRANHTATKLLDGNILIIGGFNVSPHGETSLSSCELFDEQSNSFIDVAPLNESRGNHAAIRINDGRVLVVGGSKAWGVEIPEVELFDPNENTWTVVGTMLYNRRSPQVELLNDGRVLITGNSEFGEIYDPTTNELTQTEEMIGDYRYGHRTIGLNDGTVLITGSGVNCEIYDPSTNQWSNTAPLPTYVNHHSLSKLSEGQILLTGNTNYFFMESTTGTAKIHPTLLQSLMIHQIYPNPFNSSTKIQFISKESNEIKFSIFSISGEEIFNTTIRAKSGINSFIWSGIDSKDKLVPSGIYIALMSNYSNTVTKKISLLK